MVDIAGTCNSYIVKDCGNMQYICRINFVIYQISSTLCTTQDDSDNNLFYNKPHVVTNKILWQHLHALNKLKNPKYVTFRKVPKS